MNIGFGGHVQPSIRERGTRCPVPTGAQVHNEPEELDHRRVVRRGQPADAGVARRHTAAVASDCCAGELVEKLKTQSTPAISRSTSMKNGQCYILL